MSSSKRAEAPFESPCKKLKLIQNGGGCKVEQINSENSVKVIDKIKNFNEYFNLTQVEMNFRITQPKPNDEVCLEKCFSEILEHITAEAKPGDKVVLQIYLEENPNNKPIYIGARPVNALTTELIFEHLEKVHQSTTAFSSSDVLGIRAFILHSMEGRGNRIPGRMNLKEVRVFKNKSIIDFNTSENCLPISLIMGMLSLNNTIEETQRKIQNFKRYPNTLKMEVAKYIYKLGIKRSETGTYGLDLVFKFEKKNNYKYRINIFDNLSDETSLLYKSRKTSENRDNVINIFYDDREKHYFYISSLKGFFNLKHQCLYCELLYQNTHLCPETCKYCCENPPCPSVPKLIECRDCNRNFRGKQCLQQHLTSGLCKRLKSCSECFLTHDATRHHDCNIRKCEFCYKDYPLPHLCYMENYKQKTPEKYRLIFYDFESQFIDLGNGYSKHVPNLCVSHTVCYKCSKSIDTPCLDCAGEQIFESDEQGSAVEKFVDYVLKYNSMHTVAIAHNAKSYDGQFILEELCKRKQKVNPIITGCKVLVAKLEGITFLDSLSFIPFPLSQFGKSFGLEECTKGYYPYKFNTAEHRDYVGPYPSIDMYPIASMSSKEYTDFSKWYDENNKKEFNNRNELIYYCSQDVKILMKGCLNFMFSFIETTNFNPFLQSITIADAVFKIYRKNYLKPKTLAIRPKNNYSSQSNRSKIGTMWLVYLILTRKINLEYEKPIRKSRYSADGFDASTNTVYSFEGCFFHGHTCFLNRNLQCSKDPNDTIHNRYQSTLKRLDHIRKLGYNVESIWECDFRNFLKENPKLAKELENHPDVIDSEFDSRQAVYGGRTEPFRIHYKCKSGEKILYKDICSLYPYVQKFKKYFVGHPKIIKSEMSQEEALRHDGIIKCTVLPPRQLYLPVLPYRCNKRLVFTLCRKCAEDFNIESKCKHSEDQRSLTGTWSIDEVRLAVEYGYTIERTFQIWSYKTTQYNPETGERGLFADFVDNFLKIKQEASGWPSDVVTESDKDNYIREFYEREGVQLDKNKIAINKGMRSLAKIILNSLWGRFIMRENFNKTTICNTPADLNELFASETIEVLDLFVAGPSQIYVSWRHVEVCEMPSKHVNLGVGICTTTNARIKLYSLLSLAGRNVLYCDTDSIVYILPQGQKDPLDTGKFLGDLTNELNDYGEGAYIEEFVCSGPKAYALKIYCPKTKSYSYKVVFKGVSMNRNVEGEVNFETIKALVTGDKSEIVVNYPDTIQRKKHFQIQSGPTTKTSQFTFTKRKCIENNDTVPYGY